MPAGYYQILDLLLQPESLSGRRLKYLMSLLGSELNTISWRQRQSGIPRLK
jgi:hypothetical protein